MTRYLAIAACCALLSTTAHAARSNSEVGDQWDVVRHHDMTKGKPYKLVKKQKAYKPRKAKPRVYASKPKPVMATGTPEPTIWGYRKEVAGRSVSLNGVVPELANKAREIVSTCGSRVVSAVRNTFIAGTRTKSLHASGRAVDMAGNPSCMYAILGRGWPGGYSTDYARVAHIHISYGGFEHGRRFVHGGGKKTRYAKRYKRAKLARI